MISLLSFGKQPRPLYCLGWRDSFNVSHECVAHVPDTWQCATCGRQEAESRARAHIRKTKLRQKKVYGPAGPGEDPFR